MCLTESKSLSAAKPNMHPFLNLLRDPLTRVVILCCAVALLIRLAAFGLMSGPLVADEDFQYLEPAHRIVYGIGLVPWEFVVGIRSWILPGVLSPAFEIGKLLGGDPRIALWIVAWCLSVASLPSVACAVLWGYRAGGLPASIGAGAANAVWFEIAAFAPHALAETAAASLLIPGLFLSGVDGPWPTPWRRFAGCGLLGCALVIRPQLAPAAGLGCLWCAWRGGWRQAFLAPLLPIFMSGLLDALTLSYPLQSLLKYIQVNLLLGGAKSYGVLPWYAYIAIKAVFWGVLGGPIALFAWLGAIRLRSLAVFAATVILPFFALAHKEDRFLYPALPLVFTLAGVGSAVVAKALAQRAGLPYCAGFSAGVLCAALWPGFSLLAVARVPLWHYLYQFSAINAAVARIDLDSDACGVAMHPQEPWARTPGYVRFWPNVKIYGFSEGDPISRTGAFDYVIDNVGSSELTKAGFSVQACWTTPSEPSWPLRWNAHVCLWHREGGCDAMASPPLKPAMPAFLKAVR